MLDHVFLGAKDDGAGRTGLDAGRRPADCAAVGTQGTFVGFVVLVGQARHIEWTAGDAVATADAVLLVEIHDAVVVLDDGSWRRAGLETARVLAVHTAVFANQPFEVACGVLVL